MWRSPPMVIRVATDCSGMGIPEMGLEVLAMKNNFKTECVFMCDNAKPCQQWLQNLELGGIIYIDMTTRIFDKKRQAIKGLTINGVNEVISTKEKDLDLYLCGFPCTPFTPNGLRQGFDDVASKPFWSCLKTIITLKPKVAILENVTGLGKEDTKQVVEKSLSHLKGYVVVWLLMKTKDFGIPHDRERYYMICFRAESLHEIFKGRSPDILAAFIHEKTKSWKQKLNIDFMKWFEVNDVPVVPEVYRSDEPDFDGTCTCQNDKACKVHVCACQICKREGADKKKCTWRETHKLYINRKLKAIVQFRKLWRRVKHDATLKSVPDYFEMARKRGVSTRMLQKPRERCILKTISKHCNLLRPCSILNLDKTIHRCSVRQNGLVPCLGYSCTGFYLPAAGTYLTVPQLLKLTGMNENLPNNWFEKACQVSKHQISLMIGNAMTLPVVTSLTSAALSMTSLKSMPSM